jgi:hypothetical protein
VKHQHLIVGRGKRQALVLTHQGSFAPAFLPFAHPDEHRCRNRENPATIRILPVQPPPIVRSVCEGTNDVWDKSSVKVEVGSKPATA